MIEVEEDAEEDVVAVSALAAGLVDEVCLVSSQLNQCDSPLKVVTEVAEEEIEAVEDVVALVVDEEPMQVGLFFIVMEAKLTSQVGEELGTFEVAPY